ncbi:Rieske 2Fe-2S domain-containing protein [Sinorhizobium meliloti]|uniref:Rieske 2Fe-2S domain-containing protein n=1 Tax=Rhizobium meliloti TaxID=382 RepID=UPI0004805475|nr:Rieske 2Fe-2S domain-containing protein [Sinorhizobium meliloti]UFX07148.1 Rieske 2Fe-2S domain-containing protein [Sinorhizobium meliloti]
MLDDRNWVKACDAKKVGREDVARWDHSGRSFAIFRTADDQYYATDDICTVHSISKCDMPIISMGSPWRFWNVPTLFAAESD